MLRTLALFLFVITPTIAAAQCTGPSFWDRLTPVQQNELVERAIATPFGTGNFWEATKGGTTLTIAGTMHLPDPRHDAFMSIVRPRLKDADLLLVESTLDDQAALQIHLSRNTDLMLMTDATLPDLLDTEDWDAVSDATTARGIPDFMAARMQPWFLSMTLAIPPCAMASIANGVGGLDNDLMRSAEDLSIPIAALEPWEDMLDLLRSGTTQEQLNYLRIGLLPPAIQDEMLVALTDLYFAEQSSMAWFMATYTKEFLAPEAAALFDDQMVQLQDVLLNDRNANWIPVIEQAASEHDTIFVGFGAAHLFGENGVLSLLQTGGWDISPL